MIVHRRFLLYVGWLLSGSIGSQPLRAQPATPTAEVRADGAAIASEILILVGRVDDDLEAARGDLAHTLLQMPLNYCGMRLVERAIPATELPEVDPTRVRAVGTFLLGDERLPAWLWPWLQRQQERVRMLHLGSLRPLLAIAGEAGLGDYLHRFGLGYDAREVSDPARIRVDCPERGLYPFESRPVYERLHLGPWNLDAANTTWVVTRDVQSPRRPRTPIVTGRWGGIGLQPWFLRIGGVDGDRRWYADPFAFCRRALGLEGVPAPDPSVQNGRRMFVLHVDGDGFESPSAVEPGRICGAVFRDRIVDAWPMPMTISFIIAGLTDDLLPAAATPRMAIARSILERPWVEAASHSVLHPLNWRRHLDPRSLPRSVVWYPQLTNYQHDMVAEVRDSIAFVDRWLAPADRPCRLMLWSGAANPPAAAIAAATAAGCANLNGGLFRWDALHDSVGFVSPWGRQLDGEWQTFAGAPNENEYPGYFTTMPGAFGHVDTTIERTGAARILKPANIYVHFYSAEQPPRLQALVQLLDRWARREPTVPVHASTYVAAVHDAQFACAITPTPAGFRFTHFDHCRTVRFDGPTPSIDWSRCLGICGALRLDDRLFVHLGRSDAELAFATGSATKPVEWLHLEQSDLQVDDVMPGPRALRARVRGWRAGVVVLAGAPAGVALCWSAAGVEHRERTDARGRVTVLLGPAAAGVAMAVELRAWLP